MIGGPTLGRRFSRHLQRELQITTRVTRPPAQKILVLVQFSCRVIAKMMLTRLARRISLAGR